jgi:hypothetical protein
MSASIPDLWPEDIAVDSVTPLAILNAQATKLAEKTKGLLEAEVTTHEEQEPVPQPGVVDVSRPLSKILLVHEFDVIAPALQNYRHRIMSVKHSPELCYPCRIFSDALVNSPSYAYTLVSLKYAHCFHNSLSCLALRKSDPADPQLP